MQTHRISLKDTAAIENIKTNIAYLIKEKGLSMSAVSEKLFFERHTTGKHLSKKSKALGNYLLAAKYAEFLETDVDKLYDKWEIDIPDDKKEENGEEYMYGLDICPFFMEDPVIKKYVKRVLQYKSIETLCGELHSGSEYGVVLEEAIKSGRAVPLAPGCYDCGAEDTLSVHASYDSIKKEMIGYRDFYDTATSEDLAAIEALYIRDTKTFDLWLEVIRKLWSKESEPFSPDEEEVMYQILDYTRSYLGDRLESEFDDFLRFKTMEEVLCDEGLEFLDGLDLVLDNEWEEFYKAVYDNAFDYLIDQICAPVEAEELSEEDVYKLQEWIILIQNICPSYKDFNVFAKEYSTIIASTPLFKMALSLLIKKVKEMICYIFDIGLSYEVDGIKYYSETYMAWFLS